MAAPKISVIIPAFNEERAIGSVLDEIPSTVSEVIVVDNGSTDATAEIAQLRGAVVVYEPIRGMDRPVSGGSVRFQRPISLYSWTAITATFQKKCPHCMSL